MKNHEKYFFIHSVPKMKNFARGDSVRPGFYDREVKQTQQSGKKYGDPYQGYVLNGRCQIFIWKNRNF